MVDDYEQDDEWRDDGDDPSSYNPQLGDRVNFEDTGSVETSAFYTQDEVELDTAVPYLVLEAPFQCFRKFEESSDGGYLPHFVRRDRGVSIQEQRASLGDTDQSEWPVSKFTKAKMDPWVMIWVLYIMDPQTLKIHTLQGHTAGFAIAIREFKAMRERRCKQYPPQPGELPFIKLEVVPFSTRYGMRAKPAFNLIAYGRDPTAPDPNRQISGPGPESPKLIGGAVAEPTPSTGNGQANAKLDAFAAGQETREQAAATVVQPKGKPAMTAKGKRTTVAQQDVPDDSLADLLQDSIPHQ
jgi:hypothetical protein